MQTSNANYRRLLLPPVFRSIGDIMILLLILDSIVLKAIGLGVLTQTPAFQLIDSLLLVVALVFIGWSRPGDENEMYSLFRLRAIKFSFICCILYFLVMAGLFITGIYTGPQIQGMEQVLGMLLVYQLAFWIQKKWNQ